jgi:hypothetical protein
MAGDIYVDEDWGKIQWEEHNPSIPMTYPNDILDFGDIIGGELSKDIQKIIFKSAFAITGVKFRYTTFSLIDTHLVEYDKDNSLQESIKRILKEETNNKLLQIIKNKGLFYFLKNSHIKPAHVFPKMLNINDLSKEDIYRFLDEVREPLISGWLSDYYYSPMILKNDDGNYEIQTWGYGNVAGEEFDENGDYIEDFEFPYEELPNNKLHELFELVLYGPYEQTFYNSEQ